MKFFIVAWNDAYSMDEWFSRKELKIKTKGKGILTQTVGWLYKEDKDVIVLCQNWQPEQSEDEESLSGIIVIPSNMIVSKTEIAMDKIQA